MCAKQGERWAAATAPHPQHPSHCFWGCFWGFWGYFPAQKHQDHRYLQVWAHRISMLCLLVWKREEHAKGWTPEQPWGLGFIHGTWVLGRYGCCVEVRAAFHVFLFAKLLIPQHLGIPQMSVNVKYRPLPNA